MRRLEVGPLKSGGAESLSPRSSSLAIFLKNASRETDAVKIIKADAGLEGFVSVYDAVERKTT